MTARIPSFEIHNTSDTAPVFGAGEASQELPLRTFVRHTMRHLLGRAPSGAEADGWVSQINSGVSRTTLATCLLNSYERRDQWVVRIYQRFLKRAPAHDMLRFWSDQLSARCSQEEVLAGIFSSPEYLALYGAKHENFVRALYRDLTAERPSIGEIDAWVGLLDSGSASRTSVAYQFVSGDDFRRKMIREWYLNYLDREPDRDAIAHSLEQLKIGRSAEQVQAQILSSREYFTRTIARSAIAESA